MSQTDRKYDGPPASEQKRGQVLTTMPKNFHVNLPSPKKSIRPTQLFAHTRGKWDDSSFSPFIQRSIRLWRREINGEYVIKRMKGILMHDSDTDMVWVEDQATKAPVSPEFVNPWCLLNWLEYKGLNEGWLFVDSQDLHYREHGEWKVKWRVDIRRK